MTSSGRRAWVFTLLALLCVPGVVGFDLWPLTGWRLFSLSRDATQTEWALDVVDADGRRSEVDLERLPLAYRNAAWPLAELPGAAPERRAEQCRALLAGVREAVDDVAALAVVRERRTMVVEGDAERIEEDREVVETCRAT